MINKLNPLTVGHKLLRLRRLTLLLFEVLRRRQSLNESNLESLRAFIGQCEADREPCMIVYMHYDNYPLLLRCAAYVDRNFIALSTASAIVVNKIFGRRLEGVRFATSLSPSDIRSVLARESVIVMPADTKMPNDRMAHVAFRGHYRIFGLGWAEIACRRSINVITIALDRKRWRDRYSIRFALFRNHLDEFALAEKVIGWFEQATVMDKEWDLRLEQALFPRIEHGDELKVMMAQAAQSDVILTKCIGVLSDASLTVREGALDVATDGGNPADLSVDS